jgi:hypothetical protein
VPTAAAAAAAVCDLFGISHATHSNPLRALRVHIHRLSGLELWSVTKYAAGRGADSNQMQRLALAAWLSDGNTTRASNIGQVHYLQGRRGGEGRLPALLKNCLMVWGRHIYGGNSGRQRTPSASALRDTV